ncbi:hypothetical protein PI125_g24095 [Phytophthora idaei]|nr:hypothetical protein PI125_g24095 [Phytophthora idaei]
MQCLPSFKTKLSLQLSNLTLKVDDPVLKGTRCLEPVHPTVHLFAIFCQAADPRCQGWHLLVFLSLILHVHIDMRGP